MMIRNRRTVVITLIAVVGIVCMLTVSFAAEAAKSTECVKNERCAELKEGKIQKTSESANTVGCIDDYLDTEEKILYYAYMDMETAAEYTRPVILKAREIIVNRYAWVADGLQGYVHDADGNMIERVPNFSELFPSDWDEPVLSVEVDFSYYE